LAEAITDVKQQIKLCPVCYNFTDLEKCATCSDAKRDDSIVCVVSEARDVVAMEKTNEFRGRYHVLGGTLSALDAVGPDELRIPRLIDRLDGEGVREVILALNATVDGQTTAHYIADQIEDRGGVTVTSLAQGVPIGGELDYLDDGTIGAAMRARKSF
ncbi:hypothetical protein LCGC14_1577590, partial [marine sediment metagenome]